MSSVRSWTQLFGQNIFYVSFHFRGIECIRGKDYTSIVIQIITKPEYNTDEKIRYYTLYTFLKGSLHMHTTVKICTLKYLFSASNLLTQQCIVDVVVHQNSAAAIYAVEVKACCLLKSMLLLSRSYTSGV